MNRGFLILLFPILFLSCTKTAPTSNPPGSTGNPATPEVGLPLTVNEYKRGFLTQRIITELTYDANLWPSTIRMHSYDTSGGIAGTDSFLIVFQNTGTTDPPKSYDISWVVGTAPPPYGATEHHLLYYDNQKRIVKDSTSTTTWLDLGANLFSYSDNKIMVQRFDVSPQFPDYYTPFQVDTVTMTAANITAYTSYYLGGSSPEFFEADNYAASNSPNPLYQARVANSLGAMLRFTIIGFGYVGDFISPNLVSRWTSAYGPYLYMGTLYYNWSTDATGRVVQGAGSDNNGGGPADIYSFQYK